MTKKTSIEKVNNDTNCNWKDYVPSPMIPMPTRILFVVFGIIFALQSWYYSKMFSTSTPVTTSSTSTSTMTSAAFSSWMYFIFKWLLLYPVIYLYILDFLSGVSHGIFDNLSYLGPILGEIPLKDTFDIVKYCNYFKLEEKYSYKIKFWEKLAWDHQRHHVELYIKHAIVMRCGFHWFLIIPFIGYIGLIYVYYYDYNDVYAFEWIWFINNWIYGLCYGFPTMYFIHGLAHARTHEPKLVPYFFKCLQDWHIILHPKIHRRHHKNTKRYYCIVNGWSHPLQNFMLDLINH